MTVTLETECFCSSETDKNDVSLIIDSWIHCCLSTAFDVVWPVPTIKCRLCEPCMNYTRVRSACEGSTALSIQDTLKIKD